MKIGVTGYRGRMGQLIVREILSGTWTGFELAGGSSRNSQMESFPVYTGISDLTRASDCLVDFTTPACTIDLLHAALEAKKPLVIGTTGLDEAQEKILHDAARQIPIVYAANTSIGVNMLLALVEQVAQKLESEWDIEIFESHHRNKVDAPSGTALALGKAAVKGRNGGNFTMDRNGKRKNGDIGYAVSRGGDVVGEHTVTFYGIGERLELGHKASDRSLFAKGALKAAQWINGKPAGLYTMRDVLGL